MRKSFLFTLILILVFPFSLYADEVKIGSCIYRFNDAFMLRFRNAMSAECEKIGAKIEIADSQNDQNTKMNKLTDLFQTA